MVHTETELAEERFLARVGADPRATPETLTHLEQRLRVEAEPRRWAEPLDLDVPTIRVDTTDGYDPDVEAVLDRVLGGQQWILAHDHTSGC